MRRLRDRTEAGVQLAARLAAEDLHDPLVLALPRGGVPVAFEVASRLRAPLEVFVARKLGAPSQPELGIGAIAEGGAMVVTRELVDALRISDERLEALRTREQAELERRVAHYRGDRALPAVRGRDVVLVDDGLATGVTAEAALRALRVLAPGRLLLAVPACAPETSERLRALAEVVCLLEPEAFRAVGLHYEHFDQTTDETVLELLERARAAIATGGGR